MQGADDGVAAEFLDLLIQFPGLGRALVMRSGEFRADTAETLREGGDPLGRWQGQDWRHSGDGGIELARPQPRGGQFDAGQRLHGVAIYLAGARSSGVEAGSGFKFGGCAVLRAGDLYQGRASQVVPASAGEVKVPADLN
jgi:hypothetical protein